MTDLFSKEKPKDDGKPVDDKPADKQEGSVDTYLGLILNEEGNQKYATAEEALKGSVHAQTHITTLEKELKELREKEDKDTGMEKILEALKDKGKPAEDDKPSGITPEQLAETVTKLMKERDDVSTKEQNISTVISTFNSLYGEKASETLYSKADDLGFTKDEINSMIASNPKAALKVLGVGEKAKPESDPTSSNSSINTDGFQQKGEEKQESSMGYISGKQLQNNWDSAREATYKRLGIESS